MVITLYLKEQSYDIVIEHGALNRIADFINLDRKVLILTDDGVPAAYAKAVAAKCREPYVVTIKHGEASKNFDNYKMLLSYLLEKSFTRTDCMVAVGGGVVGDLCGFVASSYMRGIDFYNVPTTLLSQVDSSIGGKVAIDFCGVKNIVGSFYQPKKVVIDPDTLKTLDARQLHAGLAESIKMSLTSDAGLFEKIEKSDDIYADIDEIIVKSLLIKKNVVEKDPKESGLRKILNFGHTIGHAIESIEDGKLLHGECVSLGMIPMASCEVKRRLVPVLEKYSLPVSIKADKNDIVKLISHDKKADGNTITIVYVNHIGEYEMRKIGTEEINDYMRGCFE